MAGATPSQRPSERTQASTQRPPTQTQTRTRNSTAAGTDQTPTGTILTDQTQAVKDVPTARSYLAKAEYIPATVDITVPQLVNTLALLAADKTINRPASNVIRAVAILLQSRDVATQTLLIANAVGERIGDLLEGNRDVVPSSTLQEAAANIEKGIANSLATRLTEGLEDIRKHITDSIDSIVIPPPPPQIIGAPADYRDALVQGRQHDLDNPYPPYPPYPPPPSDDRAIDPKHQARQLSKARQLLLDFVDPQERELLRGTSLTTLVEVANKALKDAIPETVLSVVNAVKLAHGGLLLEFNSQAAVEQLDHAHARDIFLKGLGTSAYVRPRRYNVIVYYVPLTFDTDDPEGMREIESTNSLPDQSIASMRWIKPPGRRSPRQLVAHAIIAFSDPKAANKALVEGLTICQRKLDTVKSKREPVRCMKCQIWGHLAGSCLAALDTCGSCGEHHRSDHCNSPGKFCTPCGLDGHSSWERDCPTFNAKRREMDLRTPENQLAYFPTDEPWTHRIHQSPWLPLTAEPRSQTRSAPTRPTHPPSRSLIERIAPAGTLPRKRTRTRGLTTNGDPSLPTINEAAATPSLPSTGMRGPRGDAPVGNRPTNHPEVWMRAGGRGRRGGASSGPSRLTQTRLDDFHRRTIATPAAGPSRTITLTQDIDDLLLPSNNFFAPLTPSDLEDSPDDGPPIDPPPVDDSLADVPPPDTQVLPPSSDPPLSPVPTQSPVPTHARDFPVDLSPVHDWGDLPPLADSPRGIADHSEYNISLSSDV